MSDDARAIVAVVLAAASAQTGRPWRELHAEFEVILEELKPKLTPGQQEQREAWLADITTDTAEDEGEPAPEVEGGRGADGMSKGDRSPFENKP